MKDSAKELAQSPLSYLAYLHEYKKTDPGSQFNLPQKTYKMAYAN